MQLQTSSDLETRLSSLWDTLSRGWRISRHSVRLWAPQMKGRRKWFCTGCEEGDHSLRGGTKIYESGRIRNFIHCKPFLKILPRRIKKRSRNNRMKEREKNNECTNATKKSVLNENIKVDLNGIYGTADQRQKTSPRVEWRRNNAGDRGQVNRMRNIPYMVNRRKGAVWGPPSTCQEIL